MSQETCFNSNNAIQNTFFNEADATYGFYSSKNILGTRLKLDVKPIKYKKQENNEETFALQYDFNFHKDYSNPEKANEEIVAILKNYQSYRNEAEKIIGIK